MRGTGYGAISTEGEHLGTLIDYIHLNPFRAGLVTLRKGLESYRWSSLPDYVKALRQRRPWVQAERGLVHKEFGGDTAAQRRRYLRHLEAVARDRGGVPELPDGEERSLQSTLRRGWYFGAEEFRERMLAQLEKLKGSEGKGHRRRSGYNGAQARDHGEKEAKRLLKAGLAAAGLQKTDLRKLKKSDWRKRSIGRVIRKRTVMPVSWIAEHLGMGHPNQAATLVRRDPAREWGAEWKHARDLIRGIESNEKFD
jgi:hypothetical protein